MTILAELCSRRLRRYKIDPPQVLRGTHRRVISIVTPVTGASKTNRTNGLSVSGLYIFDTPLLGWQSGITLTHSRIRPDTFLVRTCRAHRARRLARSRTHPPSYCGAAWWTRA
jgi:hypothetical protein